MENRYITLRDQSFYDLLGRVNALCEHPVTDEGWRTKDTAKHTLISVFMDEVKEYIAVLEKNY